MALIVSTTVVLANPLLQEIPGSEETGAVERAQLDSRQVIGDDPDENGYTGEAPAQANPPVEGAPAASSETGLDPLPHTEPIDWSRYMSGPQPDEVEEAVSAGSTTLPDWTAFRYINVTGATMRPRDSTTAWTYSGAGCISASGANDIFNIHLPIPNGSRIDYLRIYYYDASASNSNAWVTTYDASGGFSDLTFVDSDGAAGYGTSLSAYVGHVVDTANDGYVLNWRANQTGSTMRLCGLRVAYRDPS
jgi:hypothetical protein